MYKSFLKNGALFLILGIFSACSSGIFTRNNSTTYQDDLSKTRVRYDFNNEELLIKTTAGENPGTAPVDVSPVAKAADASVNKEVDEMIKSIQQQNRTVRYMPGYRIQLYVGNTRSEADAAKAFIYRSFPDLTPYVTFSQPTYRVKAGDFMSKSEAEQILASIRLQYTTAVIISDKIEIEKGLLQARND